METCEVFVIGMVAFEPVLTFLSVMLPVPLTMGSLKVATRFAPTATPVELSAGLNEVIVGAVVSTVAKFQVVSLEIPAKLLPAVSSMALAAIWTA